MPHSDLDKPGLNYVIQYYDINKAKIPKIAYKWMATSGLPDFVQKLHTAAHKLKLKYESTGVNELDLLKNIDLVYIHEKPPPRQPQLQPQLTSLQQAPTTKPMSPQPQNNEQSITNESSSSPPFLVYLIDKLKQNNQHILLQYIINEYFDEPHPVFSNY